MILHAFGLLLDYPHHQRLCPAEESYKRVRRPANRSLTSSPSRQGVDGRQGFRLDPVSCLVPACSTQHIKTIDALIALAKVTEHTPLVTTFIPPGHLGHRHDSALAACEPQSHVADFREPTALVSSR